MNSGLVSAAPIVRFEQSRSRHSALRRSGSAVFATKPRVVSIGDDVPLSPFCDSGDRQGSSRSGSKGSSGLAFRAFGAQRRSPSPGGASSCGGDSLDALMLDSCSEFAPDACRSRSGSPGPRDFRRTKSVAGWVRFGGGCSLDAEPAAHTREDRASGASQWLPRRNL